jgi:hypothetical protein
MPKDKQSEIHLVRNEGTGLEAVASFSHDEEVRLLGLADTALHNEQPADAKLQAGDHAREEHQRLKNELEATVERVEQKKDRAA